MASILMHYSFAVIACSSLTVKKQACSLCDLCACMRAATLKKQMGNEIDFTWSLHPGLINGKNTAHN